MNQDVLWLYVSMNDWVIVKYLITLTELFQKEPYFLFRNVKFLSYQVLIEVALIAILHDEVKIIFRWDLKLHAINKVMMMRHMLENLKFRFYRNTCLSIFDWDDFGDQVFLWILQIICPDNNRKRSFSDNLFRSDNIGRVLKLFHFDLLTH